jgi:hypothetical protein
MVDKILALDIQEAVVCESVKQLVDTKGKLWILVVSILRT